MLSLANLAYKASHCFKFVAEAVPVSEGCVQYVLLLSGTASFLQLPALTDALAIVPSGSAVSVHFVDLHLLQCWLLLSECPNPTPSLTMLALTLCMNVIFCLLVLKFATNKRYVTCFDHVVQVSVQHSELTYVDSTFVDAMRSWSDRLVTHACTEIFH